MFRLTRLGLAFCLVAAALPLVGLADEPKPPELTAEEQKLAAEARRHSHEAMRLHGEGRYARALEECREALALLRRLYPEDKYPDGHAELAACMNNVAAMLQTMGQPSAALPYYEQSLAMARKLYSAAQFPDGHAALAISLNRMGLVLEAIGQPDRGLIYVEEALAMRRRLYPPDKYPDGHAEVAGSLNNLGHILGTIGSYDQALTCCEEVLAMCRRLYPPQRYPDGHGHLAISLTRLALVLCRVGRPAEALPYAEQAAAMRQRLYPIGRYPDGHVELAGSLNNLGVVLADLGDGPGALSRYEQAVAMYRKLYPPSVYPEGHADLAADLNNVGMALQMTGEMQRATDHYRQSLAMHQRVLRRELITAAEFAALDLVMAKPWYLDFFLSATRNSNGEPAHDYDIVAPSRSQVMRLLEQRRAYVRETGTGGGKIVDELRETRLRIEQLLQNARMDKEGRDRLLMKYADERELLERKLIAAFPELGRRRELDQLGPTDLAKALPPGVTFIDVIRYSHSDYVDKKQKRTPSYVAFVVGKTPVADAPGSPMVRVELGAAEPIDTAVRQWRAAIEERRQETKATADLRRLVWDKLAAAIPAGTTTIYLAADGDLARVPWAALPVGEGRILLENYAIAQVPHGIFLLDKLKFGKKVEGGESLLALGGVDYGLSIWPALSGTATEAKAIAAIAPGQRETLTGKDATADKLKALLPQARYLHLATHGQFKADELSAEKQRAAKALEARQFGDETRRIAAKNPLGYVGLVLSNGEVLSGLSIQDLPADNLKLVTLSACETGLGEYTGGEGVQGLQRAFHLAGCPNVVASLWKVNDAATAALMTKFYHELWVNKKPPIEALREAQLTIYRRPDLIATLASAERGLKLEQALSAKPGEPGAPKPGEPGASATGATRTPTKLWAAFVLSGAGK
jgi:CHAT domain-containing protein